MDNPAAPALACLITFRTYGTWLPGDERGSVDLYHSAHGAPYTCPSPTRETSSALTLEQAPVVLRDTERTVVLRTIQEVCRHRGWLLRAVHVRTNHVHAVIWAERHPPERVMNDLKAWATRRLVEAGLRPRGARPWARHGSTRYLWTEEAVAAACTYVVDAQGGGREWAAW